MRIKGLLLAVGCTIMAFGVYAQKGVDNGTKYGSGEDSIRCIKNISLFVPYAKSGNYKDAADFWEIVYNECPAATKDIYLYGVRIVNWQISQAKDDATKATLIDKLMGVYDKRVKYFGDSKKYGKDWILSRKVQDYFRLLGPKAEPQKAYDWLKDLISEFGNECEPLAVSLYSNASRLLLSADPNFKETYISDFVKCSAIFDAQIKAAESTNNQKELKMLSAYKAALDGTFASSGAADCETLQNMYASKIEERKGDLDFLKETISLLRRVRCQDIEAYFAASGYVYEKEKSADAAIGLGKQAVKKKDFDTAMVYFEEAANMTEDGQEKSDVYYMMSLLEFDSKAYSKARKYCLKSLEANPNNGSAYILIGNMYAASGKLIYPSDQVLRKTVYYAAVDKFIKAKSVDPEVAEEANKLINTYVQYFPSGEDVFMHPDLKKGKPYRVGGWIGETTIVR